MIISEKWDIVFSTLSWLIVVGLFFAAANIYITPPTGAGPLSQAIGIPKTQIVYFVVYAGEGIALTIAKLFKTKKIRKTVLMVIYLTGFFTSLLTLLIVGFVPQVIDNIVVAVAAAICWLYWKFKTEYIDPQLFIAEIEELRDDYPPNSQN
jgi:hypothetical protein